MRNFKRVFAATIILISSVLFSFAQETEEEQTLSNIVNSYEKALNKGDVDALLQLFTDDGVLVLQGTPTTIGTKDIETFFISLFKNIDFNIKFNIEEIVTMSSDWAFIRTTARSNDADDSTEEGHEIFIFKKQPSGKWKIAR